MSLLNIDIINKKVANDTNINEKIVTIVNKFYWGCNNNHIKSLDIQPINLMGIGHIRHSQILIRVKILKTVAKLRRLKQSKKYKPDSSKKLIMEQQYHNQLQELWKVRNIKIYE